MTARYHSLNCLSPMITPGEAQWLALSENMSLPEKQIGACECRKGGEGGCFECCKNDSRADVCLIRLGRVLEEEVLISRLGAVERVGGFN